MHEPYCNTSRLNLPKLAKLLQKTYENFDGDYSAGFMLVLWREQARLQAALAVQNKEAAFSAAFTLIGSSLSLLEQMRPGQWDWTRSTNRARDFKDVDTLRISSYLLLADKHFENSNLKDASISIELVMLETFRLCDALGLDMDTEIEVFTGDLLRKLEEEGKL